MSFADEMREALKDLDKIKEHAADGLADMALSGLRVIPSPMAMSGAPILIVSQSDYDAMIEALDRRNT